MFQSILKSLVVLCGVLTLVSLSFARTAPSVPVNAMATPALAAAALAAPPASLAEEGDDVEGEGPEETEHEVCDDTEQPVDDPIVAVIEVEMNGIFWFEAQTASGGRYLINDMYVGPGNSGAGPCQIGDVVYYVCWN